MSRRRRGRPGGATIGEPRAIMGRGTMPRGAVRASGGACVVGAGEELSNRDEGIGSSTWSADGRPPSSTDASGLDLGGGVRRARFGGAPRGVARPERGSWRIGVGHVDHRLRGRESMRDRRFVERLGRLDSVARSTSPRCRSRAVPTSRSGLATPATARSPRSHAETATERSPPGIRSTTRQRPWFIGWREARVLAGSAASRADARTAWCGRYSTSNART